MPLSASNRLLMIERGGAGTIAAFPPPHTFFWAREVATNLGYEWYRKDSDASFSFGIRQAEKRRAAVCGQLRALQRAPRHVAADGRLLYRQRRTGAGDARSVLAFTHGDRYKPLPGYQVMNHHYHMDLGRRLLRPAASTRKFPISPRSSRSASTSSARSTRSDSRRRRPAAALHLKAAAARRQNRDAAVHRRDAKAVRAAAAAAATCWRSPAASVEGARRHSDKTFLVMPNQEHYGSPVGGHTDLLFSHPVYWTQGRTPGSRSWKTMPRTARSTTSTAPPI